MPSRVPTAVLLGVSCLCSLAHGQSRAESSGSGARVESLPKSLEVNLALGAAPPYLRSGATVFVLDPAKGYVLERKGTNGFTCYVQRTDYVREDYSDGLVVPECQDPEGTRTIVPVEFDVERLRAEGKLNPAELKKEILRRFTAGVYHSPARTGIAYMLSPVARLYNGPQARATVAMNMPHYMFYAPNLTAKDFGGGPVMGPYPYLISPGPMACIILNVGETEKAKINGDSQDLLKEACTYRSSFCMDGITPGR
jgi:hypothetical protein